MKITEKLQSDWEEYNSQARRLGIKTKTLLEYIAYRKGKYNPKIKGSGSLAPAPVFRKTVHPGSGPAVSYAPHALKEKQYTGEKLIGIGVMHKSNLVPIFKKEDAEEIAQMRRN